MKSRPCSLVTGGAGFIGSHVAEQLCRKNNDVVILDDLSGGFRQNVPPGSSFVHGSILDVALLTKLFEQHRFRYVYHLAAYAAEGLSHFIKRFNYENNLIGSVNLINAAVNFGAECFVFTSSIAVYGAGRTPMREDLVPEPEDSYGIAKLAVERELEISRKMFGLCYVIFRPHNVYGERQNIGDRYRNVVGIFMNELLRGEPMTIFGDGEQQRAFTYVGDVAPLIADSAAVAAARNRVFNIGADVPCTVNHLAQVVAAAMKQQCVVRHLPPRDEVKLAFANHDRIEEVFGTRPRTSLEAGVRAMAKWVRRHGGRASSAYQNLEIIRNLPPSWAASPRPKAARMIGHGGK